MKIRTGFVSNSSSSSFVIAVKKGTTKKDVVSILKKEYSTTIRDFMSDISYYYDLKKAIEEENQVREKNMTKEETYEFIIDFLADGLDWFIKDDGKYGLEIGEWNIFADEFGTEDGDALGVFLYSFTSIDTDILKVVPSLD